MKRLNQLLLITMFFITACQMPCKKPTDYVNPFIGTGAHGHTFPGATTPFGMIQLSPDTRNMGWDACSGYHYSDNRIYGFSHTHLSGTGCADLTDFLFCPYIDLDPRTACMSSGDDNTATTIPCHRFSHSKEKAVPGYYRVSFDDCAIDCEMTALARTGVQRYTFRSDGSRQLLLDLEWNCGEQVTTEERILNIEDLNRGGCSVLECMHSNDGWISGHTSYLSAVFSSPVLSIACLGEGKYLLDFGKSIKTLEVCAGLSLNCIKEAAGNRRHDLGSLEGGDTGPLCFDKAAAAASRMWDNALSCITVQGEDQRSLTDFYSALYHTMICPNLISDASDTEARYSTISIWDTYRAWNPLMSLINTKLQEKLINGMLEFYRTNGELPIWPLCDKETGCMIGYHSVSMIADAYMNESADFDAEYALKAMMESSNINAKASDKYLQYGYVPADLKRESVSLTLEYAYDDWCIARMAEKMGHEDIAKEYYRRAGNYVNIYDGATGFFRGKNANGSWAEPFSEYSSDRAFTESIPWQYRFAAVHDVEGMTQLMGGREAMTGHLDRMFEDNTEPQGEISDMTGLVGQYAHGNEPSHHIAYLYNYLGCPWKTQERVKMLMKQMYSPKPDGICGNEDCGQMSAWLVLSAAGLYCVCPGSGEFVTGSPLFKQMDIKLGNGNTLHIKCNRPQYTYVAGISLNGREIEGSVLKYSELMQGGELEFKMSRRPAFKKSGVLPYSMTQGTAVPMPYTKQNAIHLFEGSIDIDLCCNDKDARIFYTTDGSDPCESSIPYIGGIHIEESTTIKACCMKESAQSRTLTLMAVKADYAPAAETPSGTLSQGLCYSYYTGEFGQCCQIEERGTLRDRGVISYPSIKDAPDTDHFAYIFEGYLDIPYRGVWEFATTSDDGSLMMLDDKVVVDNDGSHAADMATGRVALDKGLHKIRVLYFEDYEGEDFDLFWKQDGEFVHIDKNKLKH